MVMVIKKACCSGNEQDWKYILGKLGSGLRTIKKSTPSRNQSYFCRRFHTMVASPKGKQTRRASV
jgi:hypothetical protein